jgi:hypothetical protein
MAFSEQPLQRQLGRCLSNCYAIFFGRSGVRCQGEPAPSMGEGWVGVLAPQYNR